MMTKPILLSFDVEEFDIPLEYGHRIGEAEQIDVATRGLETLLELLDRLDVTATLFTTARFATARPDLMRQAAARHEIGSHGYEHSRFEPADLRRSRERLEQITRVPVHGFRRARLQWTDPQAVAEAGYRYDSSMNPVYLPGRYNNFTQPRRAHWSQTSDDARPLLSVPVSALPGVRFPLFWLSFKHVPPAVLRPMLAATLKHDGYLNLFFHPWELMDLRGYGLPRVVTRLDGRRMRDRLTRDIEWLHRRGTFTTFAEFDRQWRAPRPGRTPDPRACPKAEG